MHSSRFFRMLFLALVSCPRRAPIFRPLLRAQNKSEEPHLQTSRIPTQFEVPGGAQGSTTRNAWTGNPLDTDKNRCAELRLHAPCTCPAIVCAEIWTADVKACRWVARPGTGRSEPRQRPSSTTWAIGHVQSWQLQSRYATIAPEASGLASGRRKVHEIEANSNPATAPLRCCNTALACQDLLVSC